MTLPLQHIDGPPSVQQNFDQIAQRFPINANDLASGQPGTTFPSSPIDGQTFVYIPAAGQTWLMVRLAPSWYFLGGSPLFSEVTASQGTTSATYVALGTAGPSITLPFSGDYDIEIGCQPSNNGANGQAKMSYDIGATGAVDADATQFFNAAATSSEVSDARATRKNSLTAVTLTAKYKAVTAGTATFSNRWMKVTPVRITVP